jgi:hypothetical protein
VENILSLRRMHGFQKTVTSALKLINKQKSLISVLHIEVVARPYVRSKISYFIVRTFDVKHHAAHGTILINFDSEKRSYILQGCLNSITGHRAKQCTGAHTYTTTHRNKSVNVRRGSRISS